jgi:CCR4-NOT transcription complex subunit 9
MLQTPHIFSHQHQYGQQNDQGSAWPQNQHQAINHVQQHAQAQAAAAAAAQAQQQHYNRIALNQSHNTANHRSGSSNDPPANSINPHLNGGAETGSPGMEQGNSEENRKVLQWVAELMDPARREGALMELSKKREQVPELALVIWHSFGVMTSLLQEIISVYPLLNPSQLTAAASNRVCNALALLQCVASHNETRGLFLNGMPKSVCFLFQADTVYRPKHISPSFSIHFSIPHPSLDRSSISGSPPSASSVLLSRMNPQPAPP